MANPTAHANISVVLSLLKAFKLAELLALVNHLLAAFAIVNAPTMTLKLLMVLVMSVGLLVFYFAIRIRIDIALFDRWDTLDIAALDDALAKTNAKHQPGKTLEARLHGAYKLFQHGLLWVFLQFFLLMIVFFLFN
jgi:hypothetical protein